VAWIEENRLKGKSFWQVSIPNDCSWCWKKLLKLRNIAKQFLSFKVGSGSQIFFWHDKWHPTGYLLDCLAPVQCMTQVFPLMLRCLRSLRVGTGTGHLPGPILLWKFKVGYLRFLLEVRIWLFGTLPMVIILVQLLGISCE
jgi:hypothetical protein